MSEPRTETGRALLDATYQMGHAPTAAESLVQRIVTPDAILAVEAEARAAVLAELRAKVGALEIIASDEDEMWIDGYNVALARVLALLDSV